MEVGKKIRMLRESMGLEQLELANKINISQSKMNKIETGFQKRIEPDILVDLSNALGASVDYIVGKTDNPHMSEDDEKAALIEEMARKYPDAEIMFDNLAGMTVEELREVDDFIRFKIQKKDR